MVQTLDYEMEKKAIKFRFYLQTEGEFSKMFLWIFNISWLSLSTL